MTRKRILFAFLLVLIANSIVFSQQSSKVAYFIRSGTLAQRPATCIAGPKVVAVYIATDTDLLYFCTSTNVWGGGLGPSGGSFTNPVITGSIFDANGNELLTFLPVPSAINEFTLSNNSIGLGPTLIITGGDTNIPFNLRSKGAGLFNFQRSSDNATTIKIDPVAGNINTFSISAGDNSFSISSQGFQLPSASFVKWYSATDFGQGGSFDTGLYRNAAGVVEVNSSVAGTWRDLKVRTYIADQTVTAGGTTGNQTINKSNFTVNFAAAASALTVTNSIVTANSNAICTVQKVDGTMKTVSAVPSAGSLLLTANAAATAETRVGCMIFN